MSKSKSKRPASLRLSVIIDDENSNNSSSIPEKSSRKKRGQRGQANEGNESTQVGRATQVQATQVDEATQGVEAFQGGRSTQNVQVSRVGQDAVSVSDVNRLIVNDNVATIEQLSESNRAVISSTSEQNNNYLQNDSINNSLATDYIREENSLEKYSIDIMITMSKKNVYPKAFFKFGDKFKDYVPILHFFEYINVTF